ncbi:hypothetical protein [Buttiauxella izardii]|uniref:Uncharacterized protein n=1 Tax=Buttiauxella izardii TaxID=82991 RepID=A0A3A5K1I1_9ENTR|nr:hypothetical protein [Buttiauxella izardii]RJT26046.1 hypothetical protein D6029_06645 [Buttiauxella izardii]
MRRVLIVAAASLWLLSGHAIALDASDFSDLEGYTVAKITKVDGDFEGCEYDKKITLINGWTLTCSTYHYSYSYSPQVAILSRDIGSGYSIKAVIGDYVYEMQPIRK